MSRQALFVVLVICTVGFADAQTPAESKKSSLLNRARTETNDAIKDADKLSRYEEPLFYGRLVEIWHQSGHRDLRWWTRLALQDIAKRPTDRPEQNRQRLVTAAQLFVIFDSFDPDASSKVLDTMVSGLNELGDMQRLTPPERAQLRPVAAALAGAASRLAESDPAKAAALARTIMSLRDGDALSPLLTKLRKVRPEAAKTMMADAIQSAGITLDPYFIAGIARQLLIARQKGETAYPQLNDGLIQAINGALIRVPGNKLELDESCMLARVARQFVRAVGTESLGSVDEALDRCVNERTLEDPPPALEAKKSPTPDDYVDAALTAIEPRDRASFTIQASLLLAPKDPARALAIATGLSKEERKVYPAWRKIILTIANAALVVRHRAGDNTGVQQVIDSIPAGLRPVVEVNAGTWARHQPDENAFAIAMLKAARRALDKETVDDSEMLVDLVNGYAAVIPNDAANVLDEAMTLIDNLPHPPSFWKDPAEALADLARNGTQSELPVPPLGYELHPAKIDDEVIDITESRWNSAVRKIKDSADRLALRLGLVNRLLEMASAF